MVSLSHVSVMNPKLGLKSKMVERTSSILGARDIVISGKKNVEAPYQKDKLTFKFFSRPEVTCEN